MEQYKTVNEVFVLQRQEVKFIIYSHKKNHLSTLIHKSNFSTQYSEMRNRKKYIFELFWLPAMYVLG